MLVQDQLSSEPHETYEQSLQDRFERSLHGRSSFLDWLVRLINSVIPSSLSPSGIFQAHRGGFSMGRVHLSLPVLRWPCQQSQRRA